MADLMERGDRIEESTMQRVTDIYNRALRSALRKASKFLSAVKAIDDGKIKPPSAYQTEEEIARWREGYVRALATQYGVVDAVMTDLNAAGAEAEKEIRDGIAEIFGENYKETADFYRNAVNDSQIRANFAIYDRRQLAVILEDSEPVFSRLAYNHLGNNVSIRRKLQNELAQATINGESQAKIIERIRSITGQSVKQARRVAQTERTRVQSQARSMAMEQASNAGVRVYGRWSARMRNTRETHAALNGKKLMQGELFTTIHGAHMAYPGDVSHGAPPGETINCFCALVPGVLLPGKSLDME